MTLGSRLTAWQDFPVLNMSSSRVDGLGATDDMYYKLYDELANSTDTIRNIFVARFSLGRAIAFRQPIMEGHLRPMEISTLARSLIGYSDTLWDCVAIR